MLPVTLVKNAAGIVSHGNVRGRKVAIRIIERAIFALDSFAATKRAVKVTGSKLAVDGREYDLSEIKNVYVIGAGKATISMAAALEEILGPRIAAGHIVVKEGQMRPLRRIKVSEASHPLPGEAGINGAKAILAIAEEAGKDDLVFCLISGGASALTPLPAEGVSLDDKRELSDLLLRAGADVEEINCVRNHVSLIKGGKLAEYIHPARIVNLIVIDEVSRQPWGPTVPDSTTFEDAYRVLERYELWKRMPSSVKRHIRRGIRGDAKETLKEEDFRRFKVQNVILADNVSLCEAAEREAKAIGLNCTILTTSLRGESSQVGVALGSIAKEIVTHGRPLKPPCALILGGETTVSLGSNHGNGGPSQELALAASLSIVGSERITIASVDTDGTDGPTEVAGAVVDGSTIKRAGDAGINVWRALKQHDSYGALSAAGDTLTTETTGTNVMDLDLVVVI